MKILVISDLYPPYYLGGYEINCRDSVEALSRAGHDVKVLTSTWGVARPTLDGNIHRVLRFDPTYLEPTRSGESGAFAGMRGWYSQLRRMRISHSNRAITRKVAQAVKPELALLWRLGHVTASPAFGIQDVGIRPVIRLEDYSLAQPAAIMSESMTPLRKWYRSMRLDKTSFERLKAGCTFLVISQAVKDHYIQAGFAAKRMHVLPAGLPSETLRSPRERVAPPFAATDNTIHLAFMGRLEPEKGPDIAIAALGRLASTLSDRVLRLDIIGSGNTVYLAQLKAQVSRLGISERVSFVGKLGQDEIRSRLQSYDAMLFPSRWAEPFGRVVIESMAQGLPVIASRSGAIPEIITDGVNGLLVPSDDPSAMAEAITGLARHPERAESLGSKAFETVRSRFTIERTTSQLEAYLCQELQSDAGLAN